MEWIIGIIILFVVLNWIGWKWIAGFVVLISIIVWSIAYVGNKQREEQRLADEKQRNEEYAKRRAKLLTKYLGGVLGSKAPIEV